METCERGRPQTARAPTLALIALALAGAVGPVRAANLCEQIEPPPPPPGGCNRLLADVTARLEPGLRGKASAAVTSLGLLTILKDLGVTNVTQGVGSSRGVIVMDVAPEVLASADGATKICNRLQGVPGLGLTSFERSARLVPRAVKPNDPLYPAQELMLKAIHATEAWERISRIYVKKVPVAVVDTGVRYTHPDLAGSMWSTVPHGKNFARGLAADNTDDTGGHGTTVAGVLAATSDNGVGIASIAWHDHVQIVIAKFASDIGGGCINDMIDAIHYAAYDADARIINLSVGTGDYSQELQTELQALARDKKNTLVVAAVGDEWENLDDPMSPTFDYPTSFHLPNVVSVQASDCCHHFGFTQYGNSSVHLAAPDVGIETTDIWGNQYNAGLGTSISAPQVSATAALISEFAPQWSYSQIMQYLIDSARDPGCSQSAPPTDDYFTLCGKSQSGGVLNVDAATGAPLKFDRPAEGSSWKRGRGQAVTWSPLFATDLCKEVGFYYSTDDGMSWSPITGASTVQVSALRHDITLPQSIPGGSMTRIAARCTDTARLERWSRPFIVE